MKSQNSFVDAEANPEGLVAGTILGSSSVDKDIIDLCPEIKKMSPININRLSALIQAYLFGADSIIKMIAQITQSADIIEYIEGLSIIIKEEGITSIEGIEEYMASINREITPSHGKKPIPTY